MSNDPNATLSFDEIAPQEPHGMPHAGDELVLSGTASEAIAAVNEVLQPDQMVAQPQPQPAQPQYVQPQVAPQYTQQQPVQQYQPQVQPVQQYVPQAEPADTLTPETIAVLNKTQTPTPAPPMPALDTGTGAIATNGYSWLGFEAARLRLRKLTKSHVVRYIAIALISMGIFALVFNFPVIYANLRYRFTKTTPTASQSQQNTTPSAPAAAAVAGPDVVIIPKLNVTVPIVYVPTLEEKQIQIGLRDGVVHYAGTAVPGQTGNVVIFGHSSNDWWQPGNYKFVFALLDRLAPGDTVEVHYQQKKYVYQVSGSKVVVPTDFSVIAPSTEPVLTLITCTPPGTSWKRLVVSSKQIEPALVKEAAPAAQPSQTENQKLPGDAPGVWNKITDFFKNLFS